MMRPRFVLSLVISVFGISGIAADWPTWRGPTRDGISTEREFPTQWSATENIAWKVALPGGGHSSPIVSGDRIFVTACKESTQERLLLCYSRDDGKLIWQQTVLTAPLEKKHGLNSFASSTPATDGKFVYVSFLDGKRMQVACYDLDGKRIWAQSPGEFHSKHGFCSPPLIDGDLVIFNGDQDALAYLVAYDKATGQERWRADRPNRTRSYCPPIVIEAAGRRQLVLSGSKSVASYDVATGQQIWVMDGPTEQFVASLVYHQGLLFLTAGYPTYHIMAIRPNLTGNVTKSAVVWHETKGAAYVPSPIAWGDCVYVVADGGVASCLDVKTGKRHWMERLGRHHSASPVAANGLLYFLDDDGAMHIVKAGTEFDVIGKNKLGEACYASPALSNGQIFIRGEKHLFCIGAKAANR
ncbi:PQQ-like beta-propeller repeat protein [Tuwongella immobilis]|uniref:Pyrrolo-quinoline quinone repeat domain-containing protein n=1 Tax=Tuwongella immobilis TaxID=692036 RepID=A0A6C2YMR4_9BACT|nr:PQQ-like beta-propeller repeat protein [Tuwongella immobilis]VIP02611.1 Pyrrolo-quinoline quinone OS=Pedosphaera parvula (strain Ellin514) GN=Cflav_PD1224 PE=4 SV=1: PQQ_2 [Tuwongella immobilis]VTS01921.1 Pyrrolo-quinoline quinone OS=Pedosphaera parvula (strain Ellin514) GN=Cflav_PD1224 PE=4 SV=1: PQQ_2 [Tuwongella immobilis]